MHVLGYCQTVPRRVEASRRGVERPQAAPVVRKQFGQLYGNITTEFVAAQVQVSGKIASGKIASDTNDTLFPAMRRPDDGTG